MSLWRCVWYWTILLPSSTSTRASIRRSRFAGAPPPSSPFSLSSALAIFSRYSTASW